MAGLPCPTLAWGGDCPACDAVVPAAPLEAAQALAQAAQEGRSWPWMERVNVNLPLRDLLGRYGPLAATVAVNPEVGIDHQALDAMDQATWRRPGRCCGAGGSACTCPSWT